MLHYRSLQPGRYLRLASSNTGIAWGSHPFYRNVGYIGANWIPNRPGQLGLWPRSMAFTLMLALDTPVLDQCIDVGYLQQGRDYPFGDFHRRDVMHASVDGDITFIAEDDEDMHRSPAPPDEDVPCDFRPATCWSGGTMTRYTFRKSVLRNVVHWWIPTIGTSFRAASATKGFVTTKLNYPLWTPQGEVTDAISCSSAWDRDLLIIRMAVSSHKVVKEANIDESRHTFETFFLEFNQARTTLKIGSSSTGGSQEESDDRAWENFQRASFASFDACHLEFAPSEVDVSWIPTDTLELPSIPPQTWDNMAYRCCNKMRLFDGNGIAYARDIAGLKKLVKSALSALKSTVQLNPKGLADLYLTFHYGIRLFVSDTKHLISAYERFMRQEHGSYLLTQVRETVESAELVLALYRKALPVELSNLHQFLANLDLLPTLTNLWDFIPYSFVVDWFLGIQEHLERIDSLSWSQTMPLELAGRTIKIEQPVAPPDTVRVTGTIVSKLYYRSYGHDYPNPAFAEVPDPESPFRHWLEGAALIIQRIG